MRLRDTIKQLLLAALKWFPDGAGMAPLRNGSWCPISAGRECDRRVGRNAGGLRCVSHRRHQPGGPRGALHL